MNNENIPARRVPYGGMEKPGDFCYDPEFTHIYIILPGSKHPDALKIQRGEPGGARVWGWDGNEEKPTLKPSIDDHNWHGHLVAGELKSC